MRAHRPPPLRHTVLGAFHSSYAVGGSPVSGESVTTPQDAFHVMNRGRQRRTTNGLPVETSAFTRCSRRPSLSQLRVLFCHVCGEEAPSKLTTDPVVDTKQKSCRAQLGACSKPANRDAPYAQHKPHRTATPSTVCSLEVCLNMVSLPCGVRRSSMSLLTPVFHACRCGGLCALHRDGLLPPPQP